MVCTITNRLKNCRELKKLSTSDLAKLMGVDVEIIEKIESGKMAPSKDFLSEVGYLLGEDLVNEDRLKNLKLFNLLDSFYKLQVSFLEFKKKYIGTESYNNFLDECVYRNGLIYPKFLGDTELQLTSTEITLFYASVEILKLKMELISKERG